MVLLGTPAVFEVLDKLSDKLDIFFAELLVLADIIHTDNILGFVELKFWRLFLELFSLASPEILLDFGQLSNLRL